MILERSDFYKYKINIELIEKLETQIKKLELRTNEVGELIKKFESKVEQEGWSIQKNWLEQVQEVNDYDALSMPRCSKCGLITTELEERTSMGVYAGRYCSDECWKESGYRDVEFDPTYCGESLEPDE